MRLSAQSRRYAVLTAVLFLAWNPSFGVTKILVFPLVNKSQEKTLEWLVPLVPEYFARCIPLCEDCQVLDPAFLFPVDSAGWTMASDSLLKVHWLRWGWNSACGGTFYAANGRITCDSGRFWFATTGPLKSSSPRAPPPIPCSSCVFPCSRNTWRLPA